ncbi:MAG TPA: four helix bundle protein [Dehalococcoidales bacterium]|nr:four helix bundle protein [Dehalococcoidales bacterium]
MLSQKSNLKNQKHNSNIKNEFRERCYNYSISIIKLVDSLPERQSIRTLSNQLIRSATSVGANIIEAKSASSKRDYVKYFEISLKSANETKYWLGLLRDALGADKIKINKLLKETTELANILAASILTMKGKTNF